MTKSRSGLGKGLGALIPITAPTVRQIAVEDVIPNPRQPRQRMEAGPLQELADSIRQHGLLQPLVVTEVWDDDASLTAKYQLIAGERRWQAAKMAGLTTVPAIVKEATPEETLALALVENIQRADLNPLEEAAAYRQLTEEFGLTQEQVAAQVGKSRAAVTNSLRLLRLPEEVKEALAAEEISEGHARALLGLESAAAQITALAMVRRRGLSVRQTEELVRRLMSPKRGPAPRAPSPELAVLEDSLRRALGTKVELHQKRKGGRIVIHYYSDEELQSLYERLVGE